MSAPARAHRVSGKAYPRKTASLSHASSVVPWTAFVEGRDMVSPESSGWIFDYGLIDDGDFPHVSPSAGFSWPPNASPLFSAEIDGSLGDSEGVKENVTKKKRVRTESCAPSSSKACREKLRRDRLNDKFVELGSILEPGRPLRTDKAAILVDAVRMVTQLRTDAQKLKDSNQSLHDKIKELKVEKNELREEKQRFKAEKERLEGQLKAFATQTSFMPLPPAIPATFAPQAQAPGNKMVPLIRYPGVAMWQFMPPTTVDTSQDHVLRPPVA